MMLCSMAAIVIRVVHRFYSKKVLQESEVEGVYCNPRRLDNRTT